MGLEYMKSWNIKSGYVLAMTGALFSLLFRTVFSMLGLEGYQEVERQLLADKGMSMLVLELVILSPILEEVVFRGFLYRYLRRRLPLSGAMLISAAAFGIYHWNLTQGIYAFAMGMLLAWSLEHYQTMKAPVVVHMAANLAALGIGM